MRGLGLIIVGGFWISVFGAEIREGAREGASRIAEARGVVRHALELEDRWMLTPSVPGRFDASALLSQSTNGWLTVDDQTGIVCRIELGTHSTGRLVPVEWISPNLLNRSLGVTRRRYDLEGMAMMPSGELLFCEEETRWVIQWDPKTRTGRRLEIDWAPASRWFAQATANASWEGIAVGRDRIYLANERQARQIVVVDMKSREVIDQFEVRAEGKGVLDLDYSELAWHEDKLWVLCRGGQCVLEVDPDSKRVLAQYDYGAIEDDPRWAYDKKVRFGYMEGLAVDADWIWLLIDNNGDPLKSSPDDRRPQLFKCRRPKAQSQK